MENIVLKAKVYVIWKRFFSYFLSLFFFFLRVRKEGLLNYKYLALKIQEQKLSYQTNGYTIELKTKQKGLRAISQSKMR